MLKLGGLSFEAKIGGITFDDPSNRRFAYSVIPKNLVQSSLFIQYPLGDQCLFCLR